MTFDELNEDQRMELKQRILVERNEQRGEGTSYWELAYADNLVSDEDARDWAAGMEFSEDDFTCPTAPRVECIPLWAVCYIINGDDSSLALDDKRIVDDYVKQLREKEHLRLVRYIDGTGRGFCPHPAFGPACDTVDFYAERLNDDSE